MRTATVAEAAGLAPLIAHLGYPSTPEQMRARLERIAAHPDYYATLVAERGGRLVGMAGLERGLSYNHDEPYARIVWLVVEPGERGRGTGAALAAACEAWARGQGAASVHRTTALHREDAHRFYERLGYERTGARYLKKLG